MALFVYDSLGQIEAPGVFLELLAMAIPAILIFLAVILVLNKTQTGHFF